MKKLLHIIVVFIMSFAVMADDTSTVNTNEKGQYQECVAVSLHTMQGRELDSIVKSSRKIKETTLIPKGWTLIGLTTKSEDGIVAPYMVICH